MATEGSFQISQETVSAAERFLYESDFAIRKAREHAHQALFFLRLLYRTRSSRVNPAIDAYAPFALEQVSRLTAVWFPVPGGIAPLLEAVDPRWNVREGSPLRNPGEIQLWLRTVRREGEERGWSKDPRWELAMRLASEALEAAGAQSAWADLQDVEFAEPSADYVIELRERFVGFLRERSRSARDIGRQTVVDGLHFLGKHLALIVSSLLAVVIVWKVEAVNSLVVHLGLGSLGIGATLLLPPVLLYLANFTLRMKSEGRLVRVWDVGGPGQRGFRAQSLEPGREVQRYPCETTPLNAYDPVLGSVVRGTSDPVKGFFGRLLSPKSIRDALLRGQLLRLGIYSGGWLVGWGIFYGISKTSHMTSSTFTVFLIGSILYALLVVGRLIDFWDFCDPRPIRVRLLLFILAALLALLLGWGHSVFALFLFATALLLILGYSNAPWRAIRFIGAALCVLGAVGLLLRQDTHEQAVWNGVGTSDSNPWRVDEADWPFPGTSPVVVVASSGGGSRAAVYTGLTLLALRDAKLSEGPAIGRHIHAISSVSGGSLANAAYIARRLLPQEGDEALRDLKHALSDDFLLPTLKGALTPGRSRGDAIEKHWQGLDQLSRRCRTGTEPVRGREPGASLGNICLSHLADAWEEAPRAKSPDSLPPFPMPLFNTATLDGHDVVLSPLPAETYSRQEDREEALSTDRNPYRQEGNPTWVYYRDLIYGIEDLMGKEFDPLLSSAVRASANFPFGFPLVEIRTQRPLFLNPVLAPSTDTEKTVYLTDGGALSNSGMWSLFRLLINKQDELKKRGVLLVLVDASRMPTIGLTEQTLLGLRAVIGDQAPIGQYLHRTMLDMLELTYGDSLAVTQIDLTPQVERNVLTTWALSGAALELLKGTFDDRWQEIRGPLLEKWEYLSKRAATEEPVEPPEVLIDRARPPLD